MINSRFTLATKTRQVKTRRLYHGAELNVVKVKRTISRNGAGRNKVDELLALFHKEKNQQHASAE